MDAEKSSGTKGLWKRLENEPESTYLAFEPTELMIRATLIFRLEDSEWKAVHRHGDSAVSKTPPS